MLTSIVIITGLALFLVLPLMVLKKYYKPKHYSISNIFWIAITLVTWPLVPIAIAYLRRDTRLLSFFWLAFLLFMVACSYWLVLNVNSYIKFQQQLETLLGAANG